MLSPLTGAVLAPSSLVFTMSRAGWGGCEGVRGEEGSLVTELLVKCRLRHWQTVSAVPSSPASQPHPLSLTQVTNKMVASNVVTLFYPISPFLLSPPSSSPLPLPLLPPCSSPSLPSLLPLPPLPPPPPPPSQPGSITILEYLSSSVCVGSGGCGQCVSHLL